MVTMAEQIAEVDRLVREVKSSATSDPEQALTKARKAVETICRVALQLHGGDPGRKTLEQLRQSLVERRALPSKIDVPLRTIQNYGNYASHAQDDVAPIDAEYAEPAFAALKQVDQWFRELVKKLESMPEPAAPLTRDQATSELVTRGVDERSATTLVELVFRGAPGVLDKDERPTRWQELVLFAALYASRRPHRFADAFRTLASWLESSLEDFSNFDRARCWHVRAIRAWRLDGMIFRAIASLHTSDKLLAEEGSDRAIRYVARIHDTLGQVMFSQGMFLDARFELELALDLRHETDLLGKAITLGNLGRLALALGDWKGAKEFFAKNLEIVTKTDPSLNDVIAQVRTHLAMCHLRDETPEARRAAASLLVEAAQVAEASKELVPEVFASIGFGRLQLLDSGAESALKIAESALKRIDTSGLSPIEYQQLEIASLKLAGDATLALGNFTRAADHYRSVIAIVERQLGGSPVELAEAFRGLATALSASGDPDAPRMLRAALRQLDGTAATDLRVKIEAELKRISNESWLLHAAGRYLGHKQIDFALTEGGELGFRGERSTMAVLFSDLRGFTALSTKLEARPLVEYLNEYLTCMTRCVDMHEGQVDKFIGDAVMALFALEAGVTKAIDAALAMRNELARFNKKHREHAPLSIGIGIHGGELTAGLIGSAQKRAYTVIGDVVNTASRVESMTKQLGATTLVTQAVVSDELTKRCILRPLGSYVPKGRDTPVAVYDVMGYRDGSAASRELASESERVAAALEVFGKRDFTAAEAQFRALERSVAGRDRAVGYDLLAEAARDFRTTKPKPGWTGEIVLTSK